MGFSLRQLLERTSLSPNKKFLIAVTNLLVKELFGGRARMREGRRRVLG